MRHILFISRSTHRDMSGRHKPRDYELVSRCVSVQLCNALALTKSLNTIAIVLPIKVRVDEEKVPRLSQKRTDGAVFLHKARHFFFSGRGLSVKENFGNADGGQINGLGVI
jgi:hypothetical protein